MALSRLHFFRPRILTCPLNMSALKLAPLPFTSLRPSLIAPLFASLHTQEPTSSPIQSTPPNPKKHITRWKPMCLYYTHGKCTKMDDAVHLETFNHNKCELEEFESNNGNDVGVVKKQDFDYFLVLDLEGKVEILEFPVLLFDVKAMNVIDFFHRFVRPSRMSEDRINEYIEGKYGKLGVDGVWHDTAIPFEEVIQQFEDWMERHQLWRRESGGLLSKAAFITCGNWDVKTKLPEQCKVSRMKLPSYFMEWINLKDIFLNFYHRRAPGMASMMRELKIPLLGSHHLGIDDTRNITRVLRRMLTDGALLQVTAKRYSNSDMSVVYRFRNRI